MENPNQIQVGGQHYRGTEYQHWDWAIDNRLGYLEGQVSKYVCRWQDKDGVQDLEKALHYLDKLIWAYSNRKFESWPFSRTTSPHLTALQETYNLDSSELAICAFMARYTSIDDLLVAHRILITMIQKEKA